MSLWNHTNGGVFSYVWAYIKIQAICVCSEEWEGILTKQFCKYILLNIVWILIMNNGVLFFCYQLQLRKYWWWIKYVKLWNRRVQFTKKLPQVHLEWIISGGSPWYVKEPCTPYYWGHPALFPGDVCSNTTRHATVVRRHHVMCYITKQATLVWFQENS